MKFFCLLCVISAASGTSELKALPIATRQLLVVTTASWSSPSGNLQRYRRAGKTWRAIGRPIPVSVGKDGLAWGRGIYRNLKTVPTKQEGDCRAPAGIFSIGPAFGYAVRSPAGCKLPYRPITERDYFVDAPASKDYNRWVTIPAEKPNCPEKLWPSFERMKRSDRLYQLGIVVQQNDHPVVKRKGSAIFLHVWRHPNIPTVGCTAMAREDLLTLLQWLEPEQQPLLVQAPTSEVKNLLPFRLAPNE